MMVSNDSPDGDTTITAKNAYRFFRILAHSGMHASVVTGDTDMWQVTIIMWTLEPEKEYTSIKRFEWHKCDNGLYSKVHVLSDVHYGDDDVYYYLVYVVF